MAFEEGHSLSTYSISKAAAADFPNDGLTYTTAFVNVDLASGPPSSVTRFGEILPLWQKFTSLWQIFNGLFLIWQNAEPTLANL